MVHGRDEKRKKPRILHIGNIANNAYQNAKILNERGYENIVLSYDYYHVMGCPEWDDAIIEGEIRNQNYPQWHRVRIKGFRRPDWFVAAPLKICNKYILAYCDEKRASSIFWKKVADFSRCYISDAESEGCISLFLKPIRYIRLFIRQVYLFGVRAYFKCRQLIGLGTYESYIEKKKQSIFAEVKNGERVEESIKDRVERDFKELFPERKCEFGIELDNYIECARILKSILGCFDIVFAYATNPVFIYLAGIKDYIAYEHGTIRDIPYQDNDLGRLMLLSYAKAKAVYCTNIDCYESAKYITKNTKTPVICGLHGIDIGALIKKIDSATTDGYAIHKLRNNPNVPLFFCPARHTWDAERNCYLKGEDIFLQAASRIAKNGYDFKIIMVEWGENTEAIKTIIKEDDLLKPHIEWIQPLTKKELYYLYSISDAVIDQFVLKAYGAISFEVLASGKPVLISAGADEELERAFFGEKVLHYSCDNAAEIYEAMKETILKTERYLDYSKNGRKWIEEHHSKECIYNALKGAIDTHNTNCLSTHLEGAGSNEA